MMSRLGRGGMGLVYAAEDVQLRRRCALKVLRPEFAEDPDNVERFLREAQAIARLSHEHIVNIFSLGRDPSGAVFFAMELLTGEDLEARLRNEARPVRCREVCEWAVQIARAVAAVHEAGLVHRDLKPGNIFLARRRDGSEFVKLLDFGIVRAEDSEMTSTGATLGTPHYMSPEQVRARPLDRRSDIYSFGVLLFRALTGRLPFRGEPFQVAIMHVEATAPRPSDVAPDRDIPEALSDIVLRALLKDPAERFQSMEDMEDALRAVLHTLPALPLAPAPSPTLPASSSPSLSLASQPGPSTRQPAPSQPVASASPLPSARQPAPSQPVASASPLPPSTRQPASQPATPLPPSTRQPASQPATPAPSPARPPAAPPQPAALAPPAPLASEIPRPPAPAPPPPRPASLPPNPTPAPTFVPTAPPSPARPQPAPPSPAPTAAASPTPATRPRTIPPNPTPSVAPASSSPRLTAEAPPAPGVRPHHHDPEPATQVVRSANIRAADPVTAVLGPAMIAAVRKTRPPATEAEPAPSTLPSMPRLVVAGDIPADPPSTSPEFPSPFAASSSPAAARPRRSLAVPAAIASLVAVLAVVVVAITRGPDPAPTQPAAPITAPAPVAAPPPVRAEQTTIKPEPTPPPPEPAVVPPEPTPPEQQPPPEPTPPEKQPTPRQVQPKKPPAPPAAIDPLKAAAKLAKACRKTHKAETGPKITIDYAVGSNGKVTRAVPVQKSELGNCLADAVRRTEFPPKLLLGQQISL